MGKTIKKHTIHKYIALLNYLNVKRVVLFVSLHHSGRRKTTKTIKKHTIHIHCIAKLFECETSCIVCFPSQFRQTKNNQNHKKTYQHKYIALLNYLNVKRDVLFVSLH